MTGISEILALANQFTPWFSWQDETKHLEYSFPGVYAIAHFDDQPPKGIADPTTAEVVYIGETCSQTIGGRLYQFDRSGFKQKDGHSGGHTYRRHFCDAPKPTFFAMLAFTSTDEVRNAYQIRCVERLLLWEYLTRHGAPPCCNSK